MDLFYQTLEDSLGKVGQPALSQEDLNSMYAKDITLHQEVKNQARLETAGKVLVGVIGVVMGGVNGGLNASQALTGITNPSNIEAPYGTKGPKMIQVNMYAKKKMLASFNGIYDGPRDIFQSFGVLFPVAVKTTVDVAAQRLSVE